MEKYVDREQAGSVLAQALSSYVNRPDLVVLALPRGGVPVAFEVAQALHAPLDVFVVRKLGVPRYDELAMGAIAMDGTCVFNEDIIQDLSISTEDMANVIAKEKQELDRRVKAYRGDRPFPDLKNKHVILVDDGIATGATMQAAVNALMQYDPSAIVVAVPVADKNVCQRIALSVDHLICPLTPDSLGAVGAWYEHFDQVEDAKVRELLQKVRELLQM
ncbi:MAG: phosphoribosyl transferase [Gammaproteobacteria bacterium RIFCSPHIGHO2_12_FULL_45_12]|nr:MAG: phosphoribosyl transferase [Gammaproteobacteria bacterium RIFCSPHIGHO2_12_FULL_45_12]